MFTIVMMYLQDNGQSTYKTTCTLTDTA